MPQRLERALLMADKSKSLMPDGGEPSITIFNPETFTRTLPQGFESRPRSHTCPSCHSTLILKIPTNSSSTNEKLNSIRTNNSSIIEDDNYLASSLETANTANMLLQALSFDAATRTEKRELDMQQLAEGVSYCPQCKVHVVTSAEELGRLFDKYDDENEEDGEDGNNDAMEWLRGSLLVTVEDAEVTALSRASRHRQHQQQEQQQEQPTQSIGSPSLMTAQSEFSSPLPQDQSLVSLLTQPTTDDILSTSHRSDATSTQRQEQELAAQQIHDTTSRQDPSHENQPTRPLEFDYDYRRKVAIHAMASRVTRGAKLTEFVCAECEMPLMKRKKRKECVVCPKLWKKIAKYYPDGDQAHHLAAMKAQRHKAAAMDPNHDPISAIVMEAHLEAMPEQHGSKSRRRRKYVEPNIAEAKQYVMQRRIMGGGTISKSNPRSGGGCNGSGADSQGTESLTDQNSSTTEDHVKLGIPTPRGAETTIATAVDNSIDWEELLVNGRAILSKRLNEGWILSSTNCSGTNCKGTPLLQRCPDIEERANNNTADALFQYCVVCGGLGTGLDGAYERELKLQAAAERDALPDWEDLLGNGRALLAERLKQGWTMSSDNCEGVHCNEMPLTNFEGGPNNCVVCAGSGSGCDGRYENYKKPDDEVVEGERDMVSREISQLLSMGWVLRESLCVRCLMPLVAEDHGAVEELCILCGQIPENNPHMNVDVVGNTKSNVDDIGVDNDDSHGNNASNDKPYGDASCMNRVVASIDSYGDDSSKDESYAYGAAINEATLKEYINEDPPNINEALIKLAAINLSTDKHIDDPALIAQIKHALTLDDDINNKEEEEEEGEINTKELEEEQGPLINETLYAAVNAPVATFGDDNTNQAGKRLIMGWTLPDVWSCHHCGGVLMSAPNSPEIGCINRGCPSALAAAYTFLPEPYESTGPVRLIGRGFTKPSNEEEEEEELEMHAADVEEKQGQSWEYKEQHEDYYYDNVQEIAYEEQYEEQYVESTQYDDGPPLEVFREHHPRIQGYNNNYDEPSILSNDTTEFRSVASSALGVILVQLDDAKYELEQMIEGGNDPQECAQKQVEIAMLVEKLASAAVAMKQVE